MLELRRLRLLNELHERGTIAAVAEALRFTPSAVSQQLAMLEREAGVRLLERAGRGVRLTDPALVLVEHATVLLERAERAEAELAAAAGGVTGRARVGGVPVRRAAARDRPRCRRSRDDAPRAALRAGRGRARAGRCRRSRWATSTSCSATSGTHQPLRCPAGVERVDAAAASRCASILPAHHPAAADGRAVSLAELAGEHWTTGHPGTAWEEMTHPHLPRARRASIPTSATARTTR